MIDNFPVAMAITLIAGLSTGIGGIISILVKRKNMWFLSNALGFAAGIMLYISMTELLQEGMMSGISRFGEITGKIMASLFFFIGFFIAAVISGIKENKKSMNKNSLYEVGIITAVAVVVHNFPEGIASFVTSMHSPQLGLGIGIAIAIHNIPEGIAVGVPIYYSTGSKRKALTAAFLSGIAEPIGGLLGFLVLSPFMNETVIGFMLSCVGGIMVYISLCELLPSVGEYDDGKCTAVGVFLGMFVMAVSLFLT